MPEAGVSARPARRYAAPWWEELDREAFQFPAAREVRDRRRAGADRQHGGAGTHAGVDRRDAGAGTRAGVTRDAGHAAAARTLSPPARAGAPSAVRGSAPPRPPEPAAARSAATARSAAAARSPRAARSAAPPPVLPRHERPEFRADRAAMWAVVLGIVLILVAAASAHGAVLH